jgi:putative protease
MGIKDAKDMIFLFAKDCWGRTVYLNSQPLFMLDRLRELKKASVTSYRLEFTSETAEEIREVLQLLNKQIGALESNREIKDGFPGFIRAGGFTRGHYYRGVE